MSYEVGRYWGRVTQAELGETKNGHPQVVVRFMVLNQTDPNNDACSLPCEQSERTIYRVITDKSAEWVANDLRILGYSRDSFAYLDPEHGNYESLADHEFEAICKYENYDGKLVERWGVFNPNSAPPVKPLDKASIRKLDAMFGKVLKEAKVAQPVDSVEKPAAAVQDIPF